ncbi:helix-turn-helix domain-containing protein [Mesonia aquimarina]|uniref:helix-turn-helix domain-containing protein n=1 Tax=Mesonia aquimarina TaxID=1504967 RepID=UPI0013CE63A6|nr:helix-turn-helix transcriptional regulator [Mesonia aquimarina]
MNYSDLFKEIRHKAKLKQTEFGEKLGVGVGTIQKIEGGEREPSNTIKKLFPYVFGEYLGEEAALNYNLPEFSKETDTELENKLQEALKENEQLKLQIETLTDFKNTQARTIELLEDRIELYKIKYESENNKPNKAG